MRIVGPQPFDRFRQRVRRHCRTEVLDAVATLAASMDGRASPMSLPNVVQPFSLAAIARAALLYGNDHRHQPVTPKDLVEMCDMYAHVDEPVLGEDPGGARLRGSMHRIAYEQFGHQFSEMENIGRTLLLFEDHVRVGATAPSMGDWENLLGAPLVEFMRIGFAMHCAALSNGGQVTRETLQMPHVSPVFAPTDIHAALAVVDSWFAATVENLKAAGLRAEVPGKEKWSLNPLVAHPIISDGHRYVMPCPRWVIDRFTPTGLYFIGLDAFGSGFTEALGAMYESYVGSQLRLITHATVHGEVVYGKHDEKTVDYFVVTDKSVALVEAKSARPVTATRLGEPEGDEDIDKKIGKAISQINNTAKLLAAGHPALTHINPTGLPVVGIVTTLEPFYLVNSFIHGELLGRADVPTIVASAHEL
jgi:hypothetical protein